MKKVIIVVFIFSLVTYLSYAMVGAFSSTQDSKCEKFEVRIKDASNHNFVAGDKIESYLTKKGLNPEGKHLSEINTYDIELAVKELGAVKKANVYISQRGSIFVDVVTRKPIIRVITERDLDFYIDSDREPFSVGSGNAIELPLITGELNEEIATGELFDLTLYIRDNKMWDDMVEQIVVEKNRDVVLIPRVGDFKIIFGSPSNFKAKFNKLEKFQSKGLNQIGWNRFSIINLKYDKQIVCTKK